MTSVEAYQLDSDDYSEDIRRELDDALFAGQTTELEPSGAELDAIKAEDEVISSDEEIEDIFRKEMASAEASTYDSLQMYLNEINRVPLLKGLAEETSLAKRIERGDLSAKKQMIEANLRLVVSIAKRYRERGVDFLDLIQEGSIGLIRSVEKYDWRRGYKFSTYSTWWIKQACQRAVANYGRTIRMPVHVVERYGKIVTATKQLRNELGRDPLLEEIKAEVIRSSFMDEKQFDEAIAGQRAQPYSFDQVPRTNDPTGKEDTVLERLSDPHTASVDEIVIERERRQAVRQAVEGLIETQREVIKRRYGIDTKDDKAETLDSVGQEMGKTRERIRQIEVDALHRVRDSREMQSVMAMDAEPIAEPLVRQRKYGEDTLRFVSSNGQIRKVDKIDGQIMEQLSRGLSNPEIARNLDISLGTVKDRMENVKKFLGVSERRDAILAADCWIRIEETDK